jgi:quercetin dioxygenase-like cupin family protein
VTFIDLSSQPLLQPVPGARLRCVHSEQMTVAHWEFEPDTDLPMHTHPHEQIVNVIEGEFELEVAGERRTLRRGIVVVVPPDVLHGGRSLTACRVIDCFHPVREDLR